MFADATDQPYPELECVPLFAQCGSERYKPMVTRTRKDVIPESVSPGRAPVEPIELRIALLETERERIVGGGGCGHRVSDLVAARTWFRGHGISPEETTPIPGADRFFVHDPDQSRTSIEITYYPLSGSPG